MAGAKPKRRTRKAEASAAASTSVAPERDSIAREMWRCLEAASSLITEFKARHKRLPTPAELQLAGVMFGELQKSEGSRELTKPAATDPDPA